MVHSWLSQWAPLMSEIPENVALAAVFSKRAIAIWGSALLAMTALCAFVVLSNGATILATGDLLWQFDSGAVKRRCTPEK